jgi:hypothetical protein
VLLGLFLLWHGPNSQGIDGIASHLDGYDIFGIGHSPAAPPLSHLLIVGLLDLDICTLLTVEDSRCS